MPSDPVASSGMVFCVRTTVDIDDALISAARLVARRRKVTLTSLIEEGLRAALIRYGQSFAPIEHPSVDGGGFPAGFPLRSGSSMIEFLEGPGASGLRWRRQMG